jgi:hypothetical protein
MKVEHWVKILNALPKLLEDLIMKNQRLITTIQKQAH